MAKLKTVLQRAWPILFIAGLALQAGCTTAPAPLPFAFTHEAQFGPPAASLTADHIFALSPAMRAYADTHLNKLKGADPRSALLGALYRSGSLQLRYDNSHTRTAAQAFDDRAGHCLSLVLMTAAFAKHLGLPVSYQAVAVDPVYTRRGNLQSSAGHINLVLQKRASSAKRRGPEDGDLTVDFLPGAEVAPAASHPLEERTVLAMFHNNLAAEHLEAGRTAAAYWAARAAVGADAQFAPALNTLGVVYLRAGLAAQSQHAFEHVLRAEPNHIAALVNLQQAFRAQGLTARADETASRLLQLQPRLPFVAFDQGQQALQAGDYLAARRYFELELKVQPQQADVHFGAAVANWRVGQTSTALQHLRWAQQYSSGAAEAQRYGAKLEGLRHAGR